MARLLSDFGDPPAAGQRVGQESAFDSDRVVRRVTYLTGIAYFLRL